jgi:hypothetical protein
MTAEPGIEWKALARWLASESAMSSMVKVAPGIVAMAGAGSCHLVFSARMEGAELKTIGSSRKQTALPSKSATTWIVDIEFFRQPHSAR